MSALNTLNRQKKATGKNRYKGGKPPKAARTNKKSGRKNGSEPGRFGGLLKTGKIVFSGVFLLVALGTISIGLVLGYYYLLNSDYFMVRRVVLHGINQVSREQVLDATGLDKPTNILALHLGELGNQLRKLPWVENVTVTRKLPDTIIVEIEERRPRTLINLNGLFYLDESGQPFKTVDAKENPELPIITGFTRDDFIKRPDFTRTDIEEVFALLNALAGRSDRFRLENISEINFDHARGISLFTRDDNVQLKVGLGDYASKMRRLGRVLAHLKIRGESEGLVYFNLECSPRVIVRRAG